MKATHFRAYGPKSAVSRREIDGEKRDVQHEIEDVIADGKLVSGAASFDAGTAKVSRVVFYAGKGDEETVVGSTEIDKAGKISAEIAEE